jgi:hypothetical protein
MLMGIGRRFGHSRDEAEAPPAGVAPGPPTVAPEPPVVEFVAFAEDCRIVGRVDLTTERLSDLLNGEDTLVLRDVRVDGLVDRAVHELGELIVGRDEIYGVVASGPDGHPARRLRTQTTHVEVELGPYHVEGDLHGTPASNPLRTVLRRAAWVPLTDATIAYQSGGAPASESIDTLLLNRAMATSFRALQTTYVVPPWERPAEAVATSPGADPVAEPGRDQPRPD